MWKLSVSVIEPGFQSTAMLAILASAPSRNFERSSREMQQTYGREWVTDSEAPMSRALQFAGNPQNVVNAMTHALEARFPKDRYLVGVDARLFGGLMRIVPSWIADRFSALLVRPPLPIVLRRGYTRSQTTSPSTKT